MQFINIFMLVGLAAVAIPIIIQILNRKNSRRIEWGAWIFLDKTMKKRKKKVLLEDILLMACRCLACGLLALAFARPFVRPDSPVPWAVTMPVLLLAMTMFGISFALWRYPKQRRIMFWGGILLFALSISTIVFERWLNLKRFGLGATKDVVLIVDGSSSMSIVHDGKTNFERAIEETKKYVELAPRNTAFAVIIGGPVPQVLNPVPVADKRVIMNALDRLYLANGTMQIAANLTAAAVTLAAGKNAVKQIVIVGDGQTVGWPLGDKDRWMTLQRVFASLKTQPIITWRTLPLPTSIRNLAIESVRPSRAVIGTDREVRLDVTLVNAGTEAVTPKGLTLTAEGKTYEAHDIHQLEPGESQTFSFDHRFRQSGGQLVTAKVDCGDDLPNDDRYNFALPVSGVMKTLILDGGSGGRMDRSATYVSLALRPEFQQADATDGTPRQYLIQTETKSISDVADQVSFNGCSSVILAGVRKLSDRNKQALESFVAAGGGLLVIPSVAADADNLNSWKGMGQMFLPAPLQKLRANKSVFDTSSFCDMLARFKTGTDLATVLPERVFDFGDWSSNAVCVAKLDDGSPFILQRAYGRGTVMLAATDFTPASGFVTKRGFLPAMHELAYSLAQPSAVQLDVHPAEGLTLLVASGSQGGAASAESGLLGFYYPERNFKGKPVTRVDQGSRYCFDGSPFPNTSFPADNFTVCWRGVVIPPDSRKYKIGFSADDRAKVTVARQKLNPWGSEIELEGGKAYPIDVRFEEDGGRAEFVLWWMDEKNRREDLSKYVRTRAPGVPGAGEPVEVTDPHGEVFYAEIFPADEGLFLHIQKSIVPGVYRVGGIPEQFRESLAGAMTKDEGEIVFSVSAGVEESTLTAITQEELSKISDYVQITQAIKDEDVIKAIAGESFGKEVWRMLAIFAFLFLVAEPFIARWIAKNRRTGDIIDTEESWIKM